MSGWGGRRVTQARAAWAQLLPLPCSRCGQLVHAHQAWHLDHRTPRSQGGTDATIWPAHRRCNLRAGATPAARPRERW